MRIVIDTNVLVSAVRSRNGASFKLLSMIPDPRFQPAVSITLYFEYVDVLLRPEHIPPGRTAEKGLSFIRRFLTFCHKHEMRFSWRPLLKDADDDFVLELAIESNSRYIVTFNKADFGNMDIYGIEAVTPAEFLGLMNK